MFNVVIVIVITIQGYNNLYGAPYGKEQRHLTVVTKLMLKLTMRYKTC